MSYRSCWKRLGIAHTNDTAAIRRAYAAKLKHIDLDRDAAGFQALRDARDEAMYLATQPAEAFDPYDDIDADEDDVGGDEADDIVLWGLGDIAAELDADPQSIVTHSEPEPVADGPIEDRDAPYHALYGLLDPDTPDRERWFPTGDEDAAIRTAFDAILADPRMEEIGYYDHQERWLATVIALSWPTSEPLVEPAVAQFGWAAHAGEIGQDPAADFAVSRAAAARFERAVQSPSHPNHGAWRELTRPATERSRRSWLVRSKPVNALLRKIRTDYPTLETYLDPWRVSLWEQTGEHTTRWQLAITFGVIVLLNIAIRMPWRDEPASAPQSPAMTVAADVTLAGAVHESSVGGQVSLADIAAKSPELHRRLATRFNQAKEQNLGPRAIIAEINQILNDQVIDVLRNPPYPLLQMQARLLVAQARAARGQGWAGCTAVLFGGAVPPAMPEWLRNTVADLHARAVLAPIVQRTPNPNGDDFARLDSDIAASIGKRVGLTDTIFTEALMNRGTAKDRCETRIATIEVALSLPQARGEPLLRMFAS